MESKVCVLLLLLCAALCTADVPVDCCLRVAHQRLPAKHVESCTLQDALRGCAISATVCLVKGRKLCLPHPEGHPWVQRLIKLVDQRKASQQPRK